MRFCIECGGIVTPLNYKDHSSTCTVENDRLDVIKFEPTILD